MDGIGIDQLPRLTNALWGNNPGYRMLWGLGISANAEAIPYRSQSTFVISPVSLQPSTMVCWVDSSRLALYLDSSVSPECASLTLSTSSLAVT